MNQVIIDKTLKLYWQWLISLFAIVIIINLIFHSYINVISFTNLFLLLIPNWFFTFWFYLYHNKQTKKLLEEYMQKSHPEILKDFYYNYHDDSNPGTKPIFILFMNKELLKDPMVNSYKIRSNKAIMLFVCVSAITILLFLISTVFIMRRMYFS